MMHLDRHTYTGLLAGTLPSNEARALAAHLAGDCPVCEEFIAAQGQADDLDGRSDAAIAGAFPPAPAPVGDLEFARIERRMRASAPGRSRRAVPLAIAASLLLTVLGGALLHGLRAPARLAWDGVKGGGERPIRAQLRLAWIRPTGDVVRLTSGAGVEPRGGVAFELELDGEAEALLLHVTPAGRTERLWRGRAGAGRTVVAEAGRPATFVLSDQPGAHRFAVVAAGGGLDEAAINRATDRLTPGPGRSAEPLAPPEVEAASLDVVDVNVR